VLHLLGISRSKFYYWRLRYGRVNDHNTWIPRDFWLTDAERKAIITYYLDNPLEGYRRLTYMTIDADIVAVSPSSVYRVLLNAGLLCRWNRTQSQKGTGFAQPLKPHEHWHIDISYVNISGTFYYLCSILDGFSRYIVHWDIRESMTEAVIKDSDYRTVPLTKAITQVLADIQANHPEGYPYVLVPSSRYDSIQQLRDQGQWDMVNARLMIINNFTRQFDEILELAKVKHGTFHDLRRTILSNLIAQGVSEYYVMKIAGHAKFSTTHEFYLEVAGDILGRIREATENGPVQNLAHIWHAPRSGESCPKNEPS
jgi:hypothetical protein